MSGAGRKVFQPGEVLTASNVQNYLMDQAVQYYAGTAARGSAIGTATTEGMMSYLADQDKIQVATGTATWVDVYPAVVTSSNALVGSVLQVVSTKKGDTFSTTNTTFTDVTGLSATITPSSTNNKILVIATFNLSIGATAPNIGYARLMRDSTAIAVGDQAGADQKTVASTWIENDSGMTTTRTMLSQSMAYLDSPASTSALTYKVQVARNSLAASTIYINRSSDDANVSYRGRTASTITVMEIKG